MTLQYLCKSYAGHEVKPPYWQNYSEIDKLTQENLNNIIEFVNSVFPDLEWRFMD